MSDPPKSPRARRALGAGLALAAGLVAGTIAIAQGQDRPASGAGQVARKAGTKELWFFFSPTGGDLSADVARIRGFLEKHPEVVLRPCLLVDDFRAVEKPSPEFAATLKELRSLWALEGDGPFSVRVWDEEGLALARELGIERLPAYALLVAGATSGTGRADRRAHVAYGKGARFEEMIRCR